MAGTIISASTDTTSGGRGRNVCVYWLLGHCRFDERCVYAHDKTYLPVTGWWTDAVRLTRLRKEFSDAAKADPLALPAGSIESILAESLRPAPWRKDLWAVVESYEEEANMAEVQRRDEAGDEGDEGDEGDWEDVDEWEERAENFGYTSADVEEMLMYGIKPWDIQSYVSARSSHSEVLMSADGQLAGRTDEYSGRILMDSGLCVSVDISLVCDNNTRLTHN